MKTKAIKLTDKINVTPSNGCMILVAKATKDGEECLVDIHCGFSRRTDDSIGIGSSVYPHRFKKNEPGYYTKESSWSLQYRVIGRTFGMGLYEYIAKGVTFTALTGEPLFDDTTVALEEEEALI